MGRRVWFDRKFTLGMPLEALPDILERLRGTPLRLAERTSAIPPEAATQRRSGGWSIQEHAGHLADLELLWLGRLDDFAAHAATLRPADPTNRATWDANHNARRLDDVLAEFGDRRAELVARVTAMSEEALRATAGHPRLGQPMTVADLCFFAAEHDDHHLAAITALRG